MTRPNSTESQRPDHRQAAGSLNDKRRVAVPIYTVTAITAVTADTLAAARAEAERPGTEWVVQAVRSLDDYDTTEPDADEEFDPSDDDPWHDHQTGEVARLAADERDAVWVGDAA